MDGLDFFTKAGLLSTVLASAVQTMGPLARGLDGQVWSYQHGVYLPPEPGENTIRDRVTKLLKDLYRPQTYTIAEHIVLANTGLLTSDPVEKLINFRNCLLDWRTGDWYPHAPEVLSTVQLGVDWDPAATCPMFDAWLPEVVPPDCIELVWELIGYLLYSGNPLHTAVMLTGGGRNGKGTLLRAITGILGKRNISAVSLADLMNVRFRPATLFGKIANIAGDIDATYLKDTALLKAITGEDVIQSERKNKDPFDFTAWAVPVFSANKIPPAADTTVGYTSRWLIIPFPNDFSNREDRTLDAKFATEYRGIAASALKRLPTLLARGQFGIGDSARDAKREFERQVDQVRYWLHESCELGEYPAVNRSELYQAYKRGVIRDSGKPVKAGEFYLRLEQAGLRPGSEGSNGTRVFHGVKILDNGWEVSSMQPGPYRL